MKKLKVLVYDRDKVKLEQIIDDAQVTQVESMVEWARFIADHAPSFVTDAIQYDLADVPTVASCAFIEMVAAIASREME